MELPRNWKVIWLYDNGKKMIRVDNGEESFEVWSSFLGI